MLKTCPNEQLIAHLFDSQPDSVMWFVPVFAPDSQQVVLDFETRYCNGAAAAALLQLPSALVGERLLSSPLIGADARQRVFEQCLQVWLTGTNQEFTYHSLHLDKYFRVQRRKVQEGVLSITQDCSHEIKAELRRQEQEKTFQQLLDASGDGVLLLEAIRDENRNVLDFRISFCNRWGYKIGQLPPDAVGKSLFSILPHLHNHPQLQLHKQVLETGEPVQFETSFRNQAGEEYGWFIVSLTKLGDGVISRYTDITRQKQHEKQIARQTEELQSILDSSINAVIAAEAIRNKDGLIADLLITRINASFSRISGVAGKTAEGASFLSLFPGTVEAGIFDVYCQVIETGQSLRTEMHYKGEGMEGWFDISAVKRGQNGVVVSLVDISPIKEAQLQLEQTVENLRRSNQSLEEFAYAASHDLQEPLRKIQVFTDRLKTACAPLLEAHQQNMFGRIENAANRMRQLINNLMSFCSVNQQKGSREEVDLHLLAQEMLQEWETEIQEKGAVVTLEQLPVLKGDKLQLFQLLENLISNSLKYAKPQVAPQITIAAGKVAGEAVEAAVGKSNAAPWYHRLSITDNGIGFDMKYAQKIFQVFQRLHGSTVFPGTGIGLAIVQKVVENHNGYITVDSHPGAGATFTVYLPA